MDVLYYWKNIEDDLKAGRIGWFRSDNKNLAVLQAGCPDNIWVIKTPKGMKGKVQLLARLVWSDRPTVAVTSGSEGDSFMYYAPDDSHSVLFEDSDTSEAIDRASSLIKLHFQSSVRGNFQGLNGQQAMRGPPLAELKLFAKSFNAVPFSTAFSGSSFAL